MSINLDNARRGGDNLRRSAQIAQSEGLKVWAESLAPHQLADELTRVAAIIQGLHENRAGAEFDDFSPAVLRQAARQVRTVKVEVTT